MVGWVAAHSERTMSFSRTSRSVDAAANDVDAGVEGNTRLTSATGLVLLVMLAVEGYTILDVRGLITVHVFVGVMLVGPVLLKEQLSRPVD